MFATIDLWIVVLAGVIGMVIGMLWYSQMFFGKAWQRMSGISDEAMKRHKNAMGPSMLGGLIAQFVMAYVLAMLVEVFGVLETFSDGVWLGFIVWLGFVATTMLGVVLWEHKPIKLYFINSFYWLVSMAVMGGILVTMM